MPYLTGDEIPEDTCDIVLTVPNDPVFRRAVWGALSQLTLEYNWEQDGDLTPAEVAEAFLIAYTEAAERGCIQVREAIIGEVIWMPYSYAPPKWLYCDGAAISRTDYPELFAEMGVIWGAGNGTTTFNLPDLNGRSVMGSGTPSGGTDTMVIGQMIGEQKHLLTTAEMPSHNHAHIRAGGPAGSFVHMAISSLQNPVNITATTQNTGGGTTHNNIHPVGIGKFIIYVGH